MLIGYLDANRVSGEWKRTVSLVPDSFVHAAQMLQDDRGLGFGFRVQGLLRVWETTKLRSSAERHLGICPNSPCRNAF